MNLLKAGKDFENLPESYVIFICEKDVLKENRQIYHISRVIEESGNALPHSFSKSEGTKGDKLYRGRRREYDE